MILSLFGERSLFIFCLDGSGNVVVDLSEGIVDKVQKVFGYVLQARL